MAARKPVRLPWEGSLHPAKEAAGALLASAAFFVLAGTASPLREHLIFVVALGGVYVYLVLLGLARLGPSYAVPLAIAGGVAIDWFYIPPIHKLGSDNWQNWLAIAIYIAMGLLVGMLASRAQRRAERSEEARGQLALEQAALRRVATLVAQGVAPAEVFAAIARELGLLLDVGSTHMARYEADGSVTSVASHSLDGRHASVGSTERVDDTSIMGQVLASGSPARLDNYDRQTTSDRILTMTRELGIRSSAGGPIVVDGRLWGVMVVSTTDDDPLPGDTESRITAFTELAATAISNTEERAARGRLTDELTASRARIVAAADEERRRVVRDLHDGAQQRLVHTVITLKQARGALQNEDAAAVALVAEALDQAQTAVAELRELAHGILPSALSFGGLHAGVEALASRMPVPVEIEVGDDRFPTAVEATAYFVVAEALTNVAKHANAQHATVRADVNGTALHVEIADDGTGTADPNGQGLLGLVDRLASSDGVLEVVSAPGEGTRVIATVPLAG